MRTANNILYLQQTRFLLEEPQAEGSRSRSLLTDDLQRRRHFREASSVSAHQDRATNHVYSVPVTFRVGSGPVRSAMLSASQLATGTEWPGDQLAIVNINRTGYYRVWYGSNLTAHLADLSSLSPLQSSADLFGLIDDYVRRRNQCFVFLILFLKVAILLLATSGCWDVASAGLWRCSLASFFLCSGAAQHFAVAGFGPHAGTRPVSVRKPGQSRGSRCRRALGEHCR